MLRERQKVPRPEESGLTSLLSFPLPLRRPKRLHALGLCLARSGRPSPLVLRRGRSGRRGRQRGNERVLRRPATPLDGALECFNRSVEFVALCDE